jgi:DNA-binding IclR family transcriptional regulator
MLELDAPGQRSVRGTQSVQRAVSVLRCIASSSPGPRLGQIAEALGIDLGTAHRIVKGLSFEGLIHRRPETRRYELGRPVYELGLAAGLAFPLRDVCRPVLDRLAQRTGDSIFLLVRSGLDAVCLERVEGGFPVQAHTLDVGARRPLGVGAAGMALLMSLPPAEAESVLIANAARYRAWKNLSVDRLRELIVTGRPARVAVNEEQLMDGVSAIGSAFAVAAPGQPYRAPGLAAISIASIASRMRGARREELQRMLLGEVQALNGCLSNGLGGAAGST